MPTKKKNAAVKAKKAAPKKATVKKSATTRTKSSKTSSIGGITLPTLKKTSTVYIESAAFFPANSTDGYVDLFQDGRRTAVAGRSLSTAVIVPVGATLKSISVHYTNSTPNPVMAVFLRKHADRHSPSGEIEMSFISLPTGVLPPDNYLTVTDNSFPDSNVIQDRFLHYIEIQGTGDFGAGGTVSVRGISYTYAY